MRLRWPWSWRRRWGLDDAAITGMAEADRARFVERGGNLDNLNVIISQLYGVVSIADEPKEEA